jgi:eukaryotic-like serine/threonine-protein kinase
MGTSTLFRHAIFKAAAGAAVAGLCIMAGTAGAAARTSPAADRGTARAAGRTVGAPTPGFANWPMFRGNLTHSGVSRETAINTTNASTLTAGWSASVASVSYSSPAVAYLPALGEAVVFVGGLGTFAAYPASGGAPLWTFPVTKMVNASPAVLNGVVYFDSTNGTIYALNAATGALDCSYATNQFTEGSPLVTEDPDGSGPVIYEGTAPTPGPGFEFAIYGPGNTHGSCTQDWAFDGWTIFHTGTWSPPAYGTNANGIPVVVFGSDDPDNSVYAVNADTGAMLWTYQTNDTTADDDVGASPTISAPGVNGFADGVVYITGKDKVTYALDLTTGSVLWQHALAVGTAGDVSGTALVGNTVYLGSDTGVYALNATTGAQVWHVIPSHAFYASPAVVGPAGKQVLITASITGHIYALNLATGQTLWTQTADSAGIWSSPAVSQGTIYITGKDGQLVTFALPGADR